MTGPTGQATEEQRNILGTALQTCSTDPLTGFTRNGCCTHHAGDGGMHTVCAVVTDAFLEYSAAKGNDLSTPRPEWQFPGLKEGDRWCLCALRWLEAYEDGVAPAVDLAATHEVALSVIPLAALKRHAATVHKESEES